MDISFSRDLDRTTLLVKSRLPNTDTERMCLVDGLLSVLEGETLSVAQISVIFFVVVIVALVVLVVSSIRIVFVVGA